MKRPVTHSLKMKNRRRPLHNVIIWSVLAFVACVSCKPVVEQHANPSELAIRQVHEDYVDGWLQNDESKVMALFLDDARIQPNRLAPIEGKNELRKFWFPKDGSKTIINRYETEIQHFDIQDTLANTTHHSILDWTYQQDTTTFSMLQKGINTTLYRKQADGSWKIWRSMWTDYYAESR